MSNIKSLKDTAAALGVSESTLNKWRVSGFGPAFVKMGSRVYYREQDIAAFIDQNVRTSTSEAAV